MTIDALWLQSAGNNFYLSYYNNTFTSIADINFSSIHINYTRLWISYNHKIIITVNRNCNCLALLLHVQQIITCICIINVFIDIIDCSSLCICLVWPAWASATSWHIEIRYRIAKSCCQLTCTTDGTHFVLLLTWQINVKQGYVHAHCRHTHAKRQN